MNIFFDVTFSSDCVPDPAKGRGHEDFQLHGRASITPRSMVSPTRIPNATCARARGAEPNPDGKIKDKGCGARLAVFLWRRCFDRFVFET